MSKHKREWEDIQRNLCNHSNVVVQAEYTRKRSTQFETDQHHQSEIRAVLTSGVEREFHFHTQYLHKHTKK